jgi:4-hydroxyphenylpyruvate dioxygenase
MGTDGFEFVEYTAPDPEQLGALFEQMGFTAVARHRSKDVILYRQGRVHLHRQPRARQLRAVLRAGARPSACAFAIRGEGCRHAYKRALELGAKPFQGKVGPMELNIPAIRGIGDSLIYLSTAIPATAATSRSTTSTSSRSRACRRTRRARASSRSTTSPTTSTWGRMDVWAQFYEKLFNFREIRYFDIQGKKTGPHLARAHQPLRQAAHPDQRALGHKSQIQEYLDAYHGEGIQHIALSSEDIFETVETLRGREVKFLDTPDTYYERVDARVKDHGEDLERMKRNKILLDGEGVDKDHHEDKLLQIFTANVIGPIFFEIIQRKGNQGFGEGNFRALFESIEADRSHAGSCER